MKPFSEWLVTMFVSVIGYSVWSGLHTKKCKLYLTASQLNINVPTLGGTRSPLRSAGAPKPRYTKKIKPKENRVLREGTITQEEGSIMADQVTVTNPVKIESDSKQRVAYDLAMKIADHSGLPFEQKDKQYWLTLYRQCYKAVTGHSIEGILKED